MSVNSRLQRCCISDIGNDTLLTVRKTAYVEVGQAVAEVQDAAELICVWSRDQHTVHDIPWLRHIHHSGVRRGDHHCMHSMHVEYFVSFAPHSFARTCAQSSHLRAALQPQHRAPALKQWQYEPLTLKHHDEVLAHASAGSRS